MPRLRLLLALLLLACTAQALAQSPSIRERMTAQEFTAAGLDKLSPEELAALDAWLQRGEGERSPAAAPPAMQAAIEQAREEGRQEVVQKNRGFFHFGSEEPIESSISGEFRGFAKGRRYVLANGQEWEQIDGASLAGVRRANPAVKITPALIGNAWWLQIDGYNTRAKVQRVE